ncbi:MAG: tRNA uridine-5-carboxymethylaminomethyl(34) synthesis GTPase MnmE, partial [bacterium]
MKTSEDTIAAIATAAGEGGISVIRVSGPESLKVADRVFRCSEPPPSRRKGGTFVHGYVMGPSSDQVPAPDIDEALLLIFRAPHSYTREDIVEIQGHGGSISAQRILRRLLDSGARLAEPGEFTKRAFLNGRIDLVQAEAVLDLIRASSDRAATAAVEQLNGALSDWCATSYANILSLITALEAALDFADDEMPPLLISEKAIQAKALLANLMNMLSTWNEGHILRDGALTVISGKPNVGKSTLFNALLGVDRSIVADLPGTTRDTIEENLLLDGVLLRLVDTAGLRSTDCDVESQGVLRARSQIEKADLHIHVLDASQQLSDADRLELNSLPPERTIVVLNKADLGMMIRPSDIAKYPIISGSLLN